jgi:serine/threonine protein phosphatase 1
MPKNRTFCLGDVHGGYLSLLQVLERCDFNKDRDTLIVLGDVTDGWPETSKVITELMSITNLIPILGNHCFWTYNWLRYSWTPNIWTSQGGLATIESYKSDDGFFDYELMERHKKNYFNQCLSYYKFNGDVFIHGGFVNGLGNDDIETYIWDRTLWSKAKSAKKDQLNLTKQYKNVFIGHTSIGDRAPQLASNVWNLDTGGGWEGRLTIMDVKTKEFWQSDKVAELYKSFAITKGFKFKNEIIT